MWNTLSNRDRAPHFAWCCCWLGRVILALVVVVQPSKCQSVICWVGMEQTLQTKNSIMCLEISVRDTGTLCLGRIQSVHHHHQSLLLKRSQDNEGLKIIEAKSQFWSLVLFLGPGSLSRSLIPVLDCDLDLDYDSQSWMWLNDMKWNKDILNKVIQEFPKTKSFKLLHLL